MKVHRFLLVIAAISAFTSSMISHSDAQEPVVPASPVPGEVMLTPVQEPVQVQVAAPAQPPVQQAPVSIFDPAGQAAAVPSPSSMRRSKQSVAELRQSRALYRANQRVARMEYNLWMGREPLRPQWNSIPMMSSRYTNNRIYVPVYVYPR